MLIQKFQLFLGRSFLATGKALIDVVVGKLKMRAHDKDEVLDVYRAMKLPALCEELSSIKVLDLESGSPLLCPRTQ